MTGPDPTTAGDPTLEPPTDGAGRALPIHCRSIEFEAFDHGETIVVSGRLRDRRPWADGVDQVALLHDMELHVTVRVADLTIVQARAEMHRFPHTECPAITGAFEGLVGLSVARGYGREVQRRFAGPAGCTHLDQLARALGPMVIQVATSRRARRRDWVALATPPPGRPAGFPRDSCHVWAEGGVAEQKLAAGWRPGDGGYPAPPLAEVLRSRDGDP